MFSDSDSASSSSSSNEKDGKSKSKADKKSKIKNKKDKKNESEDDSDNDIHRLTINEHYAKAFARRKEREELTRLKEKYGPDVNAASSGSSSGSGSGSGSGSDLSDSDDSSSDTDEDSDGAELTPAVDAAILRTLVRIRRKDPSIYEDGRGVFDEEHEKIGSKELGVVKKGNKEKTKPLHIKQHILNSTLDPNYNHDSSSEDDSASDSSLTKKKAKEKTHVEEQEELRKETIRAFHDGVDVGEKENGKSKKKKEKIKSDSDSDKNSIEVENDKEEEEEEEDDLLIPRSKTRSELELEEEEYRRFLEREVGMREVGEVLGGLIEPGSGDASIDSDEAVKSEEDRKKKKDKKDKKKEIGEEKDQKEKKGKGEKEGPEERRRKREMEDSRFLMDYILNRGWIDRSKGHVPTYGEITGAVGASDKKSRKKEKDESDEDEDEEDEEDRDDEDGEDEELNDSEFEELAETFETSYNFRFEEPDASHIPTHPRLLPSAVRRVDTKRKDARERKKARKDEKMLKKREELKRMRALMLKEEDEKRGRVAKEGGLKGGEVLKELDLEGEWDPEKHDMQMGAIYGEGYDGGEGDMDDDADDMEKPTWDEDIDITDILPPEETQDDTNTNSASASATKKKKKKKKKDAESEWGMDEGGVDLEEMDADVVDKRRYEKGNDELDEEWDGTEEMRKRKLEEYMDEMYGMEFNDMVGDLPTRFKYTPVTSQTFGLSPVEILLADDKDLNQYVSIKKYAPYRKAGGKVKWEKLKEFKDKMRERGVTNISHSEGGERGKKRKGKKERERLKKEAETETGANIDLEEEDGRLERKKRKIR